MLVVEVNGKQSIEKALKTLKRKWDKSKSMQTLREKKEFTKKSIKRRQEIKKAAYIQKKYKSND
jgi:small subunit ribosomal protein S21